MFDGIDAIAWGSLSHAYGSAEDVPDLLRDLTSDDSADRRQAFHQLFGNIYHQGTVYEATPYAVPFLVELLDVIPPMDRGMLVALIAAIAGGSGYHMTHVNAENADQWNERLAQQGTTLTDVLQHERRIVDDVRREASKGIQLLIPYLRHHDSEVRLTVAVALGKYPHIATISLSTLRSALIHETDDEVREALAQSISELEPA